MSPDLDNLAAILDGYGAPPQLLADCVGKTLPLLTNDQNELVCRTWLCYLFERERLLQGEEFDLFRTLYRIADRVGGCSYDYSVPQLHCFWDSVQWTKSRCGFFIPSISTDFYRWAAVVSLKLTTLSSIWAIAPDKFCYENWSDGLRAFPFTPRSERIFERIIDEKLRPEPVLPRTQLSEKVKTLLKKLSGGALSRRQLEDILGVKRTTLRTHYIDPAEALGLVEKTCPQRFAKEQRYRLTAHGREALVNAS